MTHEPAPSGSTAADETQAIQAEAKAPKAPRRRASDKTGPTPRERAGGCLAVLLNLLAALLVLSAVLAAALVVVLFQFPGVLAFVPGGSTYMVPTEPAIAQLLAVPTLAGPTASASFPTLPPIWTPTLTPTVTLTPQPGTPTAEPSGTVPFPTYTSTFTPSPTATAPQPTPRPTATGPTPRPTFTRAPNNYSYTLQDGGPTYLANFINTAGCNWFGIVGRVFGLDNNPVLDLTVHLEGGGISADAVTGSGPPALGPGSYLFPISDHPIQTTDTYQVQLRNNTGTPYSDVYSIPTYGDCTKNMVMVNFLQNH